MRSSRSAIRLAAGVVAVLSIACDNPYITGARGVNGYYALQTVNGAALPVTVTDSSEGVPVRITFMLPTSITLLPDLSVQIISTVRFTLGTASEVQTDTAKGTYALNGQQVTFSQPGSPSFTAAWNGANELTVIDNGIFVFRK